MNPQSFFTQGNRAVGASITLALLLALFACGGNPFKSTSSNNGVTKTDSPPQKKLTHSLYENTFSYVHLERIEDGAQPNDHPFNISDALLRTILIKLKIGDSGKEERIFNDEELTEIVEHLSAALSKASPQEDVTFAVAGKHGRVTATSPQSVTTGRMFVKNGAVNIIFNEIRGEFEIQYQAAGWIRPFVPGSRNKPSVAVVQASSDVSYAMNNRRDWILLAESTIPPSPAPVVREKTAPSAAPVRAPAAPAAAPIQTSPQSEPDYSSIEKRLTLLKGLRDKGLITEQEFNEKRKEILKSL